MAHKLGISGLGEYSISFGVASSFCYLVGLGAPEGLVKLIETNKERPFNRIRLVCLSHLFSIGTAVFAVIILYIISLLVEISNTLFFTVVWVVAWGCNISASQSLNAIKEERLGVLFFYSLTALTSAIIGIVSVLYGEHDVSVIIQRTAIAFCCLAIVSSFVLYRKICSSENSVNSQQITVWRLICTGMPFSVGRFIQAVILWAPVWLAEVLHSKDAAGISAALIRLGVAFGALMAATRFVFRRWFVQELNKNKVQLLSILLSTLGSLVSFLAVIAAIFILLIGKPILTILFGYDVGEYNWLMALILLGIAIEAQFGVAEDLLRNAHYIHQTLILQTLALGVQLVIGYILFSVFGWPAVIYGYLIQLILYQSLLAIWLRRYLRIELRPIYSLRAFKLIMKLKH
jgi:hypothetical protein